MPREAIVPAYCPRRRWSQQSAALSGNQYWRQCHSLSICSSLLCSLMRYARRLAETVKKWQHERDVGRDGDMEWRRGSKDQTLTAGTVEIILGADFLRAACACLRSFFSWGPCHFPSSSFVNIQQLQAPVWAIFQPISHIHVCCNAVYHDSLWSRQDINPDAVAFAAAIIPGGMHGNPDVRGFQSAGGKLMMYYGPP